MFRAKHTATGDFVALKRIQIFNMMDEKSRWVLPGAGVVPRCTLPL